VKLVTIPGLLILAFALWRMSFLSLKTPLADLQWLLILRGFGLGLCAQAASRVALSNLRGKQLSQGSTLNSVVRSCSSAMGVAIMTTLVSNRRDFHYVRLAEQVTATSPAGAFLQQLTQLFVAHGYTQPQAKIAAIQEMVQMVQRQAFMLAVNDTFLFTMGTALLTILIFLFLIRTRRPSSSSGSEGSVAPQNTEAKEEEEEAVLVH